MNRGKDICKELKAVRKRIAEENDIPLEIPECTYKGPCKGTCPRCEAEVQFLENALAKRIKLGKVATVAGLALTLGAPGAAAQSVDTVSKLPEVQLESITKCERMAGVIEVDTSEYIRLRGTVTDSKTNEPLPFVNVVVLDDDDKVVKIGSTGFDGKYNIHVAGGVYSIRFSYAGYDQCVRLGVIVKPTGCTVLNISLRASGKPIEEVIVGMSVEPHIEIGPEGNINTEIQGVQVRIQD